MQPLTDLAHEANSSGLPGLEQRRAVPTFSCFVSACNSF